jgi:multidrug resistance protein, MATE family
VLAFSTVDTLLVARHSSLDLAALAVGSAAYVTIFIGFMGVVLAISPIVGRLYGAGEWTQAGEHAHQTVWVALGLSALGAVLLIFPEPFLVLSQSGPEVEPRIRGYLTALAFSLPAALLFTVYRGFNTAISRPRAVMALQVLGLLVKLPLSAALVFGLPGIGLPAFGVVGCGWATAAAMWLQLLLALWVLRQDPFYKPFALWGRGLARPNVQALSHHLSLGIPMGLSILVEVTAFAFMAIFIARMGTTAVAGHQIAANLGALLFMMPLAIGNATSTLVAQRIGAKDLPDAHQLGWHGLRLGAGMALLMGLTATLMRESIVGLYTRDPAVAAAAAALVAWIALFHLGDAIQGIAAFVLRAYQVTKVPLLILAISLWGVGLSGGYALGFGTLPGVPDALRLAPGFWAAAAASLWLAAVALCLHLRFVVRKSAAEAEAARA